MLKVRNRQLNLKTYYYLYKDNIDGIEGKNTKSAYLNFQKKEGLKADSIYGEKTNNKLIEVIKNIQIKLNSKGYDLQIDGVVGNNTITAIKDFQKKNELTIDGIVGNKTMNALNKDNTNFDNIKYFKKEEFTCKCGCGLNNININLVKILDDIRAHFNKPMIITSGCRCIKNNNLVGGVKESKHLYGKAADFVIVGVSPSEILNYTNTLVKKGILRHTYGRTINMGNAVHVDIN